MLTHPKGGIPSTSGSIRVSTGTDTIPQRPTIMDQSVRIESHIDRLRSTVDELEAKCQPITNGIGINQDSPPSNPYAGSSLAGSLHYHAERLEELIMRLERLYSAIDL